MISTVISAIGSVAGLIGRLVRPSHRVDVEESTIRDSVIVAGKAGDIHVSSQPAVPEIWWERPGAPQFHFSVAQTGKQDRVLLQLKVNQTSGGDTGPLRGRVMGPGVEMDWAEFTRLAERRYEIPPLDVRPPAEAATDDLSVDLELKFWWDGDERHVRYVWPLQQRGYTNLWDVNVGHKPRARW